jgi:GGDEF domain-containing protein
MMTIGCDAVMRSRAANQTLQSRIGFWKGSPSPNSLTGLYNRKKLDEILADQSRASGATTGRSPC